MRGIPRHGDVFGQRLFGYGGFLLGATGLPRKGNDLVDESLKEVLAVHSIGSPSILARMKAGVHVSSNIWSKAFHLYLANRTLPEISKTLTIPLPALKSKATQLGWEDHREALIKSQQENAVQAFRKLQDQNLVEVATRHLDLAKKIDEHVDTALQKNRIGVRQLKDLSSTLANTHEVAGKITGLTRLTSQDAGKPLLVQFNIKVGQAASQEPVPVSVDVESAPVDADPASDTITTFPGEDTASSLPDPF
jgi:hypothetical protein